MVNWLLAVALTAFLVEVARRFAPAIGLVDRPTDRKSHQGEIPLVGGIAIFLGLLLGLTFFGVMLDHWAFLAAGTVLIFVGIWDDVHGVPPQVRLLFQGGAVLLVAYFGDTMLYDIGAFVPGRGTFDLGWLAIPFTVFAGIGLINAFNMSDGVDGLCGTLALVALTGLGVVAVHGDRQTELILIVLLAAGLVGFLAYNMRVPGRTQAKAFLGDAGSYFLGLSVFYLAVRLSQGADRAMEPVIALWFCMLPLFDTVGMILRRLARGRSPFSADREHIHHVFLLAKFTVTETWGGLTIIAIGGIGIGLAAWITDVSEGLMVVCFVIAALLYYWMIKRAWRVMRFLSRSINRRSAAKQDRRSGADRRQRTEVYYLNGIPTERRSGNDRRHQQDDRRNQQEESRAPRQLVVPRRNPDRPDSKAARGFEHSRP